MIDAAPGALMDAQVARTVVIFDCESDGRPRYSFDNTRSESEFRFVQCTCVCALIVPVAQLPKLDGAREITCWRDVATSPGGNPFEPLLEAFDAASVIVGYNALEFDFPLLLKHYGNKQSQRYLGHRIKCLDLFARLRMVSNHWPKLDDLLRSNGLATKVANGKEAIRMWQANERGALEEYCKADVSRTAELALLPALTYGLSIMPEHVYGLMPMVRAVIAPEEEGDYVVV